MSVALVPGQEFLRHATLSLSSVAPLFAAGALAGRLSTGCNEVLETAADGLFIAAPDGLFIAAPLFLVP